MKNCLLTILFFISLPAAAKSEFLALEVNSSAVACIYQNQRVHLSNTTYSPYEKARDIRLLECNKVKFLDYEYLIIRYEAIVDRNAIPKKILVYEVALSQKETGRLVTMRSEVVDSVSLASDVVESPFRHMLKVTWGKSLVNQQPMLKMDVSGAASPTETYLLRQDLGSMWFVNVF